MPISSANTLVDHLRLKGIQDENVLIAIAQVPRERFVLPEYFSQAYTDHALPICCGQTISQPYIVSLMSQLVLNGKRLNNVLEIGTGSGYQAAVLSLLCENVYTIERIKSLYDEAKERLQKLNYKNIRILYGDGFKGWPEHAPFDGIIVTAAANTIPQDLLDQLADNGRLVIPVNNDRAQDLVVITRKGNQFEKTFITSVIFVPMIKGVE